MNAHARIVGNRRTLTHEISAWVDGLYTSRLATSAALRTSVASVEQSLARAAVKQHETQRGAVARMKALAEGVGCEVFAKLYSRDVEHSDAPAPDTEFVDMIHDAIEYDERLLATTENDADMAAVAAASLLAKIAPLVEQMRLEDPSDSDGDTATVGDRARAIMRRAVDEAASEVEDLVDSLNSLAPSLGHKPSQHDAHDSSRMKLATLLATNADLRRVLELAGRLRRLASADRKADATNAKQKIVGVECGRDVSRALPSELAALRSPHRALRALAAVKLASGRMRQYKLGGKEPQGRGPIVVCVDESGSMGASTRDGLTRQQYASACAIAMLGMAQREERDCTIVGFDTRVRWSYTLRADGSASIDGGASAIALRIACSDLGGGTDFGPVLAHALDHECGVENDRADLVLVTDGYADVPSDVAARLDESRENGLRLFALTVGGGSLSAAVQSLAHEVVDVDSASDAEVARALA